MVLGVRFGWHLEVVEVGVSSICLIGKLGCCRSGGASGIVVVERSIGGRGGRGNLC